MKKVEGLTCPPNPDPVPMRVPLAAGCGLETLDRETDEAFGGADLPPLVELARLG